MIKFFEFLQRKEDSLVLDESKQQHYEILDFVQDVEKMFYGRYAMDDKYDKLETCYQKWYENSEKTSFCKMCDEFNPLLYADIYLELANDISKEKKHFIQDLLKIINPQFYKNGLCRFVDDIGKEYKNKRHTFGDLLQHYFFIHLKSLSEIGEI